jgi:hypothetical protein
MKRLIEWIGMIWKGEEPPHPDVGTGSWLRG